MGKRVLLPRRKNHLLMALTCVCLSLLVGSPALADQTQIRNYEKARKIHWQHLYPYGGFTLYCGEEFEDRTGLNVEYIYPASWMGAFLGCGTRKQCRKNSERFNRMEADLHNLYPARADINRARSNFLFAMIEGEEREFGDCDFERDTSTKVAEPRPITRGNVARVIFYMHSEYGLPVDTRMVDLLKQWNRTDPPSCHEMRRNNTIEELQGTRNRFIDHPRRVEDLEF
jgi:deoxyribonuclease-1